MKSACANCSWGESADCCCQGAYLLHTQMSAIKVKKVCFLVLESRRITKPVIMSTRSHISAQASFSSSTAITGAPTLTAGSKALSFKLSDLPFLHSFLWSSLISLHNVNFSPLPLSQNIISIEAQLNSCNRERQNSSLSARLRDGTP